MGRTVLAYSIQLQALEKRLIGFRKALRKDDQRVFDSLMRMAKMQVQAGVMASSPNPADSIFLSALIELKKEIDMLKHDIKAKEQKLKELEKILNHESQKALPEKLKIEKLKALNPFEDSM